MTCTALITYDFRGCHDAPYLPKPTLLGLGAAAQPLLEQPLFAQARPWLPAYKRCKNAMASLPVLNAPPLTGPVRAIAVLPLRPKPRR